jgi:DNA-binding beta-propeller fold protein YncE
MKTRLFVLSGLALLLSQPAFPATVPSLDDTINLQPGVPCYGPTRTAINTVTHRVYAIGGASIYQAQGRLTVYDADAGAIVAGLSFAWPIDSIAVNEATNTIYISTNTGADPQHLQAQVAAIDGVTNQIKATYQASLGFYAVVDPTTGRIFSLYPSAGGNSISVNSGDNLSTLATITLTDGSVTMRGSYLAIDPPTRHVYVTDATNATGNASIGVINADTLGSPTFIPTSGWLGHIVADTSTNKVYASGYLDGSTDTQPGVVIIDGTTSTIQTTMALAASESGVIDPNGNSSSAGINPTGHRLYLGSSVFPTPHTLVINTQTNSVAGSLSTAATNIDVLPATGMLYVCQFFSGLRFHNSIGELDPVSGALKNIVTGYRPFAFAINKTTDRLYVADQYAPDVLALKGSDHSVLARIPVGVSNTGVSNDPGGRGIGVSETLNRIYLTRVTDPDPNTGMRNVILDVIDGSTNQLTVSVMLTSFAGGLAAPLAVDDAVHHIYAAVNGTVYVLSTDSNSIVATLANVVPQGSSNFGGAAANPVTHRVYVGGGAGFGGNNVAIIDGNTNQLVKTVTAGALPGPIAINTTTNRIFVANTGAGSVDNSVTVINGATDSVATTLSNTHSNTGDAVTGVTADEATNTIYVGDNSNQSEATGRVTVFDGNNSYTFVGQVAVGRYPSCVVYQSSTHQVLAGNSDEGTISVLGNGVPVAPPVPPHGGLSATVFRVNGSASPGVNVADTALHFNALQSGTPADLIVKVQFNTTANNNAIDWSDLNNGSNGYMTIDKGTGQFVLSSANYPLANGIYFRALSTAPGYADSPSNVLGPFNLTGTRNHLGTTTLYVATNGPGQEMNFRAAGSTDQATITFYVQATTTPDDDNTWVGLNDGRSGQMHPFADETRNYLDTTSYPPGTVVYFRAVSKAVGFVDSVSNILGVTNVIVGTPPAVDVLPPRLDQLLPGSGSGTAPNDPLLVSVGTFKLGAQASSSEQKVIKRLGVIYDGGPINDPDKSGSPFQMDYTTSVPGDHIVKAFATDERGVTGYASPVYLRVVPSGGKLFKLASSSGSWSDPANWRDGLGNPGIPGNNDVAVIDGNSVSITQTVTVAGISLVSGSINGSGAGVTVTGFFSIAAGQLTNLNLTIDSHATLTLVGDNDVPVSGSVTNLGTIRILGRGGIVPVKVSNSAGMHDSSLPVVNASIFDGIAAFFTNLGDFVFHRPSVKPKPQVIPPTPPAIPPPRPIVAASFVNQGRLITNDGGSVVSHDGASILANDGATVVSHDGASLITNDGGSVVSHDGASVISNDGGSVVSHDGASLTVRANASASSSKAQAATSGADFTQTGGETNLRHLLVIAPVTLNGGVLSGSGVIAGDLTNNGGFIWPGHAASKVSILGNFTQAAQGTLIVENGGPGGGESDLLQISGTATLGGKLDIRAINSYKPDPADTFSPLSYSSVSGSFSSVSSNATLTFNANGALATNNVSAAQPSAGQALNIATRMSVQTGDNVLIAGFIVTGPGGSTKKVLIRGMGPSLAQFGVTDTLSDPFLELHNPDGSVVSNDNWQQGDTSQIPSGFAPSDPRESVIVATLTPGNYSAVVKGAHGETGIGIAEVYDLDSASQAKLANISTRGFINTGDNVMIGGFIIGGTEPAKILVRAIGPSLIPFGVQGALQATTLELHDSNGSVISNEGWRSVQESEIIATTIPPSDDRESAILATLVPGNYTAIVRGKNDTTGIAVVEAYNLQ